MIVEIQDGIVGCEQRSSRKYWTRTDTDGIKNLEKVLKEHTFMDTTKGACVKASRELYNELVR